MSTATKARCEGSNVEGIAKPKMRGYACCANCRFSQPFKRDGSANDIMAAHYVGERIRGDGWISLDWNKGTAQ